MKSTNGYRFKYRRPDIAVSADVTLDTINGKVALTIQNMVNNSRLRLTLSVDEALDLADSLVAVTMMQLRKISSTNKEGDNK